MALISTIDNPYNPHSQFREWMLYDLQLGHNTCGLLARLAPDYDDLSVDLETSRLREIMSDISDDINLPLHFVSESYDFELRLMEAQESANYHVGEQDDVGLDT